MRRSKSFVYIHMLRSHSDSKYFLCNGLHSMVSKKARAAHAAAERQKATRKRYDAARRALVDLAKKKIYLERCKMHAQKAFIFRRSVLAPTWVPMSEGRGGGPPAGASDLPGPFPGSEIPDPNPPGGGRI